MNDTIKIIKKSADELGLKSSYLDSDEVILRVDFESKKTDKNEEKNHKIFIASTLCLNDEVVQKIAQDKAYTYLLLQQIIKMPKTFSYIDPNAHDVYEDYASEQKNSDIVRQIISNHSFPMIVKANSLKRGINVFLCKNNLEVEQAVNKIYNHNSANYDHVLISQDYIKAVSEYRVVVYNGELQFAYKKDNSEAQFVGNLSPLHFENAKAVLESDEKNLTFLSDFIKPIFEILDLKYAGLDIIFDAQGTPYLLEINTKPGFSYYIKDNGDAELVKMFKKILADF